MIAVLFGPPGSGKGTQAARVARRFGLPHVSTGEILRLQVEGATPLGREVEPLMAAGDLVSDDLMVRILVDRLGEVDAVDGALLDGFPRTVPQASRLDDVLTGVGRRVDVVLFLQVPEDVLLARILRRAELDHRADDTVDAFGQRMMEYQMKTAPVMDFYEGHGTPVALVDGDAPIEVVGERIADILARGHWVAPT